MSVTYYAAIPFVRSKYGDLVPDEAIEAPTAAAAIASARHLSAIYAGVMAIARTGDPELGLFQPSVILVTYGETPDEVE